MGFVGCVGSYNGHGFLSSGHKLSHNLARRIPFLIVSLVFLLFYKLNVLSINLLAEYFDLRYFI
jgi:hypothetical protein